MSIKLNDTHLMLLSVASQRDDHCLIPPTGPKRRQLLKAAAQLLETGFLKEIRAKTGAPIWRRDEETTLAYALKLTVAGARAIAVDDVTPSDSGNDGISADAAPAADPTPASISESDVGVDKAVARPGSSPTVPRRGTKIAQVIDLLERGCGSTLDELVAATGWLPHTTRAALTGLRKRGYGLALDRTDKERGSIYRITSAKTSDRDDASPDALPATDEALPDRPQRATRQRSRRAA